MNSVTVLNVHNMFKFKFTGLYENVERIYI